MGIFPAENFATENWKSIQELADDFIGPFPKMRAVAFDAVKNRLCSYRGYRLCSVDAVTCATDGRIYFIEFKDVQRNPIAQLKKKAFDSLLVFWLAIGQGLSMDEIRSRAVFWYVTPNDEPTSVSDELIYWLDVVAGIETNSPQSNQLEELRSTGLYADTECMKWDQFVARIERLDVSTTVDEFLHTLEAVGPVVRERNRRIPRTIDSLDFKTSVLPLVSLRSMLPYDRLTNRQDQLHLANDYDADKLQVTIKHDWSVKYPVMELAATCFDSFAIWCAAFHAGEAMDNLGSTLYARIDLTGTPPDFVCPPGAGNFIRDFYDVYHCYWPNKFGLSLYEQQGLYAEVAV